jgi:putative DNA primase/helicase
VSDAETITLALGGRWSVGGGMCRRPCHDDRTPSLSVRDGYDGELWVTCFAGCPRRDIYAELRRRGLLPQRPFPRVQPTFTRAAPPRAPEPDPEKALKRWRDAQSAQGTIVEKYLRARGITLPVPKSLRHGTRFNNAHYQGPTMLAPDAKVIAVHDTLLTDCAKRDRSEWARLILPTGVQLGSGAIRLAKAGEVLGLAEGIEDALSAMQITVVPCWATLGSKRMDKVAIPDHVRELVLFADNDDAGRKAVEKVLAEHKNKRRGSNRASSSRANGTAAPSCSRNSKQPANGGRSPEASDTNDRRRRTQVKQRPSVSTQSLRSGVAVQGRDGRR